MHSFAQSRVVTWFTAMTLFIALAIPIRLGAQEQKKGKEHSRYIIKDLGTLGGPSSFFFTAPIGPFVNNRGTVVGAADTPGLDPLAPNCASPDCQILHGFQWRNGVLSDLGTLPGGSDSAAFVVSGQGLILGQGDNGLVDPLTGVPEVIAILWKDGQIINLGTLGGGFSGAIAINDRAQVTGFAQNAIPDPFSILGVGTETRAVLWQDGVIQDLGTLGGPDAWGAFISNRGQIVGWSYTNSTPNPSHRYPDSAPIPLGRRQHARPRHSWRYSGSRCVVGGARRRSYQ